MNIFQIISQKVDSKFTTVFYRNNISVLKENIKEETKTEAETTNFNEY